MWFNPIITLFLRTPLHALLGDMILLTVTGKKTGKQITTPVGFYREGDCLWILTNRDRTWWRNVGGGKSVTFLLHGRELKGVADTILGEGEVALQLQEYLGHIPMAARSMGVQVDQGRINTADLVRLAKEKLFVRINIYNHK